MAGRVVVFSSRGNYFPAAIVFIEVKSYQVVLGEIIEFLFIPHNWTQ